MEFEKNIDYIPSDQHGEVTYFIYNIFDKLTKIGITSNNVKWRFKDIKAMNPNVTLLFTINHNDYMSIESDLHKHFKDKNYHNEWFNLNKDDFVYIMNKYKNSIKRYKINTLLTELGMEENDIENLTSEFIEPFRPTIKRESIKIIEVGKKEIKKEVRTSTCLKCNKLLKRNEVDYCKICDADIKAELKFREHRNFVATNAAYFLSGKKFVDNMAF